MIRRKIVQQALTGVVVVALLAQASPSFAYDPDTHCLVTYIACLAAGFTHDEAVTVAAVDQGMDDSPGVVANGGRKSDPATIIPNVKEEWLWHALDRQGEMGPQGLLRRKEHLWRVALTRKTPQERLIHLGVFFHYLQDTWAHRHHYGDPNRHSKDAFTTYNTPYGHGYDFHQPDRPPFDLIAAYLCLEETMFYTREFVKQSLKRDPGPLFWEPITPLEDPDREEREYNLIHKKPLGFYNVLPSRPTTRQQAFLFELIKSQSDVYKADGIGAWDEAPLDLVAGALRSVGTKYDLQPDFNSLATKSSRLALGFGKLTTDGLLTDVAFTVSPGGKSSATSAIGLQANETVSIDGNTDLSSIIKTNDGACVYGIKLRPDPRDYNDVAQADPQYLLEVDARGPTGRGGKMCINFLDESGATHALNVSSSSRQTYHVRYNNVQPTISLIRWSNRGDGGGRIPVPATDELPSFGGNGGKPFSDADEAVKLGPITKVEVRYGNEIDGLRLFYGPNKVAGAWHGGTGGKKLETWDVPAGESIVRVEGQSGDRIDNLRFFTDRGHSSPYFGGGKNNNPFIAQDEANRPLRTILGSAGSRVDRLTFKFGLLTIPPSFGGNGGKPFSDADEAVKLGPITKVEVRYGNEIDGLRLFYGPNKVAGAWHGGTGGKKLETWDVPAGESIVRVEGQSGDRIDNLRFFTDRGHSSPLYGGKKTDNPFTAQDEAGRSLQTISGRAGSRIDRLTFNFQAYPPTFGGMGGKPFSDPEEVVNLGPITKVEVRHSGAIDGLRLFYGPDKVRGAWHGGTGGTLSTWDVTQHPGESIVRVDVSPSPNDRIENIQFITDQGHSSPRFGGGKNDHPFRAKDETGRGRPLRTVVGRAGSAVDRLTFRFGTPGQQ